jgi:hypothetical protein
LLIQISSSSQQSAVHEGGKMDARVKTFTTKDGKRTLTIRFVAGEPRAWITDALPDYQDQHYFTSSIEDELCNVFFPLGH